MGSSNKSLKEGFENKGAAKAFHGSASRDVPSANMAAFNQLANNLFSIDMKLVEYDKKFAGGKLLDDGLDKIKTVMLNLENQQAETRKKIQKLSSKGKTSQEESKELNKKEKTNAGASVETPYKKLKIGEQSVR